MPLLRVLRVTLSFFLENPLPLPRPQTLTPPVAVALPTGRCVPNAWWALSVCVLNFSTKGRALF